MVNRYWDVFIGIFIFVFSIVNYFLIPYQDWAGRRGPVFMRPEYFPIVILIAMAILGAGVSINAFWSKNYEADVQKISLKVVIAIAIALTYSIAFEKISFYIITPTIILLMALFFGERRIGYLVGLPIILTFFLYYSAKYGLKIVLP